MKKLMMLAVGGALSAALPLVGDTETVSGITWNYTVRNGKAEIRHENYGTAAIPTSTTGALSVPSTLGGYPVGSIGAFAFDCCSALTSVTIPDGVTSIGWMAFYNCFYMTNITISSSVTDIGYYAFGLSGLTSVTIPNGVMSIGDYAFFGCRNLASVTISDNVTSIGHAAFDNCFTSLFDTETIPGVKLVDGWVVGYTDAISGVLDLTGARGIGVHAFLDCYRLTSVMIPHGVVGIGDGAFSGCSGLSSVTIPDSVTSIGNGAFSDCGSLESFTVGDGNPSYKSDSGLLLTQDGKTIVMVPSGLRSVTIPDTVTSITHGSFTGCGKLTSMTIPASVTRIEASAFSDCSGMEQFVVAADNSFYKAVSGLLLTKNGRELVAGVNGDVVVPSSVTHIGSSAFSGRIGLTSVTIPTGVKSIGVEAFASCRTLMSVTIPVSVTSIEDYAFEGCSGMVNVIIPNSVRSLGFGAFKDCSGLMNVTISASISSIGHKVFSGCRGMTSVTIPDGVTKIGDYAFENCSGLTSVTIPNSVTSVGYDAFDGCSGLTSVMIPSSVTDIDFYAFYGCNRLTSVIFSGDAPTIGYSAFSNVKSGCTAYVRRGSTGWGVDIPGTWNGLLIQYIGPVEEWAFGLPLANTAFSFDQTMVNCGTSTVELISGGYEYEDAALGKAIKLTGFDGPWSPQNLDFSENWTILATARISSEEDAVLFGIGSSEAGQAGFALASGGTNMVTLSYWSPQERHVDLLTVPVADMEKHFHSYALRARGLAVELFVDGVLKGSTSFPSKPSGRTAFQFFSILQGSGETGLGVHVGSSIDDWRFYNEALQNRAIISYAVLGANGQGEGSVTAIGDVPFVQVAAGVTLTVLEPELSAAELSAKITPQPHEEGQNASFFKVKAESVVGGLSFVVVLDEEAVDPDATAAEIVNAEVVAAFGAVANGATVSVPLSSAKPGLYYGIAAASDLSQLDGAAANAPLVRAGTDGVAVPVAKPAGGAAFFKVIVSDRAR